MVPAAELFTRHVFVDLETTGLNPLTDEVIEVGALFIERGVVQRRISRLFRSRAPLTRIVQQITGLHDDDLRGCPPFSDFLPELQAALTGWTVVAHNAPFERSFLPEVLGHLSVPLLDSCELLHYLYPELQSHSLDSAIRWCAVGRGAVHRALKDCEDTFAVVCRALARVVEEGRGGDVAELIACLDQGQQPPTPMVRLLRRLHRHCRTSGGLSHFGLPERSLLRPQADASYEERAAQAYLRALVRRTPEHTPLRLSLWFQEHFPALERLRGSFGISAPTAAR